MSNGEASGGAAADRSLFTSRVIAAPRERVFEAFHDPVRLARWWGPKGFTNTFELFELRPGGSWRFFMHPPGGGDIRNESVFVEVAPPERVVLDHVSPPRFRMAITLEDLGGGKTRVGWRQTFDTADERRRVEKFAVEANEQNLDRLAAEVSGGGPSPGSG